MMTSERVLAKEDMWQRLYGNCTKIGLSVVVDRGRGSTTTNHEGLTMMVTCGTKQVNKIIRTELIVQRHRKK